VTESELGGVTETAQDMLFPPHMVKATVKFIKKPIKTILLCVFAIAIHCTWVIADSHHNQACLIALSLNTVIGGLGVTCEDG
jgi:hypothetical protein